MVCEDPQGKFRGRSDIPGKKHQYSQWYYVLKPTGQMNFSSSGLKWTLFDAGPGVCEGFSDCIVDSIWNTFMNLFPPYPCTVDGEEQAMSYTVYAPGKSHAH